MSETMKSQTPNLQYLLFRTRVGSEFFLQEEGDDDETVEI